jgi:hypothetical protein
MKKSILVFAMLSASPALSARAEGFFVGGDIAPIVYWKAKSEDCFFNCSPYSSQQDSNAFGFGINGGQWLWSGNGGVVGCEAGYDNLGNIIGSTTATFGLTTSTGNWKHTATAVHAAAIAEGINGKHRVYSKIGLYRSTTKTEGTYVIGGGTYSSQTSGTGLLLGVGYKYEFARQFFWVAGMDGFIRVKVSDPINPATTTSENLLKVSFGIDYNFK